MLKSAFLSVFNALSQSIGHQTLYGSLITVLVFIYGFTSTPLFWVLIGFFIIDYILGMTAAFKNKEMDLDIALFGIVKKFYICLLIVLSALIDFSLIYLGINTLGLFNKFIMATLLGRELGSITRNADKAGLWVPRIIKEAQKAFEKFGKEKIE